MERLCLIFFLVFYPLNTVAENSSSEQCNTITISAHPNYPPFHWRTETSLTGASIDVTSSIFRRLGLAVNIEYVGPWKRVLKSAELGKIDFIPALKKNAERQQYLHFTSTPFAANPVAVFVRVDDMPDVHSLDDLKGKFGSINAGDRHGEPVDSFVDSQHNMQRIHGLSQNFQMLKLERTDYFITSQLVGTEYIKANNIEHFFGAAIVFNSTEVHNAFTHAFATACPDIVAGFEKALATERSLGFVSSAIKNYGMQWAQLNAR